MIKPINNKRGQPLAIQENPLTSEKLIQIKRILALNRDSQEKLKKIRDQINTRMRLLDDYVCTHRLKTVYPPASALINYLKFERNITAGYRDHFKQQEAIRNTTEEDCQIMKKLSNQRMLKTKIHINFQLLPNNPCKINFEQLAQKSDFKNGLEVYKKWLEFHATKLIKRPFQRQQEELLVKKQKLYGDNWQKICQFFENRQFEELYYEFHNRINPDVTSGRWTIRQNIILIVLVEHFGLKRWAEVSKRLKSKSQLQVRERFCNVLDTNKTINNWTPSLENKLLDLAQQHNYSWKLIAKLDIFRNKTDNSLWRKFRNIMMKKSKEQILKEVPNTGKKRLADKILKYKQTMGSRKKYPKKVVKEEEAS